MLSKRATDYADRIKINTAILKQQLAGLTDADLLLQPDMRGNCANWVLGHIVYFRNYALKLMGGDAFWGDEEAAMYNYNTPPITGAESPHLSMDTLMEAYDRVGEALIAQLETLTDAALDEPINERSTLAQALNFQFWHEAYHTGQFEYLRQLAGVDDAVP